MIFLDIEKCHCQFIFGVARALERNLWKFVLDLLGEFLFLYFTIQMGEYNGSVPAF